MVIKEKIIGYKKIRDFTHYTFSLLLEIVFPRYCLNCGKEGEYICEKCEIFLSEVPPSKEVFSIWECDGLMEKLVWQIKYRGIYHIIDEIIEKGFKKVSLELAEGTIISYVPIHKKKENERGFNQAELIAKKLGDVLSLNLNEQNSFFKVVPLLIKIKDNKSQVGLNPKEREENVKGVFEFSGNFIPKNVLLVDDVYTTGATSEECIKVLKKVGVKNVEVFTIARKLRL